MRVKDVKDKMVAFSRGTQDRRKSIAKRRQVRNSQWNTNRKTLIAKQKGAAAAIVINPSMDSISRITFENTRRTGIYYPPT
ncbi:MAG: hypothetical protein WKF59_10285 [Chitinophagaceae bacterium]